MKKSDDRELKAEEEKMVKSKNQETTLEYGKKVKPFNCWEKVNPLDCWGKCDGCLGC